MPEEKFNFQDTLATQKIFALTKRIKAVCGGTSASKTISILVWLIDYAQSNYNEKLDVMSESYPHLEDGAIKDFKSIMIDRGYWEDVRWNESKHFYHFETGTKLKFISIDKLGKARGPRRDVLFLNEVNNIPFNICDQLMVRTKKHIWMDWNPTNEFWYYEKIEGKRDHDFLRLTYLDCLDVLDQRIIDDIESHKDNKNWWLVYGLGELGEVEGKIYKEWKIIEEIPHEARLEVRGLDFGYSNNPTAIVDIYYYNGGWIFDQICYMKGLTNKQIADILTAADKGNVLTKADSAEPKSIDEISDYGVNIFASIKGQGSVNKGIQFLQGQRCSVTKRSLKVIKEYRNYLWKVDKDGRILNIPEDLFNHSMDAIRYGLDDKINEYTPQVKKESSEFGKKKQTTRSRFQYNKKG